MSNIEPILLRCRINPQIAREFAPHIDAAFLRFGITAKESQAGFLAHAIHESADFTRLEENLNYTTAERLRAVWPSRFPTLESAIPFVRNPEGLANQVYGGRMGNGDANTGEGWKYRGRGLFQLTGRANYMAAGDALSRPYKYEPELVSKPQDAALTAVWYWSKLVPLDGSFADTIKKVNGGQTGAAERMALYSRCLGAMQ